MGLSRISAWTIAGNNVVALWEKNAEGKFKGVIAHGPDHEHHPHLPIVSTNFIYDTVEQATEAMNKLIEDIRKQVEDDFART